MVAKQKPFVSRSSGGEAGEKGELISWESSQLNAAHQG